ncbi:hypothetical protein [Pseudarthrobacter sp. NIBRBAC000502770]|uniref:hypothetical protein n=1 Tax=Pseudarthrobacter sp. NIBRBAC000502770 TaxID=2590785 RepID=UPI0011400B7B|nr:hypothetical protein [Pseudarthrobacter sp. NIBRBAC000502770]QDG88845.1 hypothetical protein NIBR502770_10445 [Pseudarthrobacter sp. NIBRBAC000502770]
MTEQPVETEQQFLGNETPAVVIQLGTAPVSASIPKAIRQHYVPNAHLRRPSWSSVDDVELAALARRSAHANKLAAIAKEQAVKAEEALKLALEVEEKAVLEAHNAEQDLLALVRKDAGK